MKQETYKENMDFISKASNYNRYLVGSIKKYLGNRILDIGCGIGNTTNFLKSKTNFIIGIDVSSYYLDIFKKNIKDAQAFLIDITDCSKTDQLKGFMFDTIFCSNVLEHIKDDMLALRNMHKILKKDGRLVLIVPNYKFLYGAMDRKDLHCRRYNKKDITQKLNEVGFKIKKYFCLNFIGIFWWYSNSKIIKKSTNEISTGRLINIVIPIVRIVDKLIFNSMGASLAIVAEPMIKRGGSKPHLPNWI